MKQTFIKLLAIVAMILSLAACGGGGGSDSGGTGGGTIPTASRATFIAGNDVEVASQSVDDSGGTITVSGTGTYLDGTKVTFPAGALPGAMEITVGYNDGTVVLPEGVTTSSSQKTITIHTNGSTSFSQPVEITIPYTDDQDIPIPSYVDMNGQLHSVLVKNIDATSKTLTFVTFHASTWTLLGHLFGTPDLDSEFRPGDDGFKIVNYGSTINNGGECFGMTMFAQWYYDQKMASNGEFYSKYMDRVGTDSSGNNLTGQDVIATRAHSAANQSWNWTNYVVPNINTSDEYRYEQIIDSLRSSHRPVIIAMWDRSQEDDWLHGHAVLAYGADEADGQIFIYNPNDPGSTSTINYNSDTKQFENYDKDSTSWNWFVLDGEGTYDLHESLENIFQDAEHNFTSDNMPHISITSHQNGETVYTRNIDITGTIESSEILIKKLDVFVGNEKFSTNVADDGSFSVGLSLNVGEQTLRFVTKDDSGNDITPNNLDANPFTINVALDTSVMLVTLTWDKNDTDVDLYVIDPNGDYSSYYHQLTADGGELDYDITTGYGPEHWTLSSSDVVRWNQASYIVRAHYYSDNGNGGTNYKLSVKLYEGTDREVEYVKTGYLSANDSGNDQPNDTGADWAEFTVPITLTSTGTSAASAVRALRVISSTSPLNITSDIPSPDVRRAWKNQ